MTNTYKLKSGKIISEGQTITAEELTVADGAELINVIGEYSYNSGKATYDLRCISIEDFPITILKLQTPEPAALLTLEGIMEGLRHGKRYRVSKTGFQSHDFWGEPTLYIEDAIARALDPKNGWTVTEVV